MGERMVRQELRLGKGWVVDRAPVEEEIAAGYVLIRFDEDLIDITRLGVHPENTSKGLGTRLLQKVFEEGGTIILTVQKNNLRAMRLYHRHGFEIVAHLHSARAWVMRRAILR
jgi:ribosomal protein S18 acetylase RimI-like enzyme